MATILHLETTTTNCSVCLAQGGRKLATREHASAQYSHAEELHPFILEVLQSAKVNMANLDAVAVSKGPGSYTGLRIGVSAAKGICYALDIPLISVSTLKAMARQVSANEGYVIPLLDARRMEVYSAIYDHANAEVRETQAEVISEDSFRAYLNAGSCTLMGPGASKCKTVIQHENATFITDALPSAREMVVLAWEKWQQKDFENVAYFEPYYLKDFVTTVKKPIAP